MTAGEVIGFIAATAALVAAYTAFRKFGPEARKIGVETLDVNVRIAGDLRDDALSDYQRIREEMATLRGEFHQYKIDTESQLVELAAQLRGERAEKRMVVAENERLTRRVAALEEEVKHLKNGTSVPDPPTTG